jgi:hypothetical protein
MTIRQYRFNVSLQRQDPSAGPNATLRVMVTVPVNNDQTAKLTAESQYRGYRATGASRVMD